MHACTRYPDSATTVKAILQMRKTTSVNNNQSPFVNMSRVNATLFWLCVDKTRRGSLCGGLIGKPSPFSLNEKRESLFPKDRRMG